MTEDNVFDLPPDLETDLNLDLEKYVRHLSLNSDFYSQEEGFFSYQIQDGLQGAPKGRPVEQDLDVLAEAGILEKEETGKKLPDRYRLPSDSDGNRMESVAEEYLGWTESYIDGLRRVVGSQDLGSV
jgi:hypothetical protein